MSKRKMNKVACIKCMSTKECKCLPEKNGEGLRQSTELYIYKTGVVETEKALKVILAKQDLGNGVDVKSGTPVWIPHAKLEDISNGGRMVAVPNWKLNEIIRNQNFHSLRQNNE